MKYIAQCTSGLQEAAAGLLSKDRALAATVRAQEDGLVVFDATCSRRSLQGVPYLNNVFVVLHTTWTLINNLSPLPVRLAEIS